ncbi:MAG TPA: class I SAM-dependent methyltransferase, partial [Lacipirellulaceae bacterium]|nr:class I SAM-dependent methyltransferase [Lacipirellulaceae bacterium]
MRDAAVAYRWNTSVAAEAFDAAAEFIHPFYLDIQDQILAQLQLLDEEPAIVVDLGGGSGRLVERILTNFPSARAILVDQSEPFLALAERRLKPFGTRARLVKRRLQEDWAADLPDAARAIVSMSAIHHLDPAEKRALFQRCYDALVAGGVFLNGDEYRSESDAEYLSHLEWWVADKNSATERGLIPASFAPVFEAWCDRNVRRFGEPKQSGDDCHETIAAQTAYLRDAGFVDVK